MLVSLACRNLMASWFAMGTNSSVTSHEPHETLTKNRARYDEALAKKLIVESPFNKYGSILITPTDLGVEIARERFKEQMIIMQRGGDIETE